MLHVTYEGQLVPLQTVHVDHVCVFGARLRSEELFESEAGQEFELNAAVAFLRHDLPGFPLNPHLLVGVALLTLSIEDHLSFDSTHFLALGLLVVSRLDHG